MENGADDTTDPDGAGTVQDGGSGLDDNGGDQPDTGGGTTVDTDAETAQRAAVIAIDAATWVASGIAVVLPIKDLQGIFELGQAPPSCPTLETDLSSPATMVLTMTYGAGCNPALYSAVEFSGTATGDVFIAVNAFDVTLQPPAMILFWR
ncbi:MAG: hypothetical protein IH898_08765, partial [Planctomycetes bacterium]|nr:hypothetical protein [Planctomycetota bacterium]